MIQKLDLTGIDNIVFDFGAVLINIDYKATITAFEKLGIADFKQLFAFGSQQQLFDDLETGRISAEEFYKAVRKLSGLSISDKDIENAWNAMLFDIPLPRLQLLEQLNKDYKLYLFSNTNHIHLEHIYANLEHGYTGERFESLFSKAYYSHQQASRKPELAIYRKLIDENQLDVSRTLYIDDLPANLEPAVAFGIRCVHLEHGAEVLELFDCFPAVG